MYAKYSCLKINFDKTSVIGLERKKISTDTIKTRWEISWGKSNFKLLGIHFNVEIHTKEGKRKVQGVPQSQTAALPRHQEEEETDKTKQAQIEQTYNSVSVNLNYKEKLSKMKNLIQIWKRRYITPIGKITVIKSVLISL